MEFVTKVMDCGDLTAGVVKPKIDSGEANSDKDETFTPRHPGNGEVKPKPCPGCSRDVRRKKHKLGPGQILRIFRDDEVVKDPDNPYGISGMTRL